MRRDPIDVLVVGTEDSITHTVLQRLRSAGADLSRVHFLKGEVDGSETFTVPDGVPLIRDRLIETKAKLLYVDAIMGCLASGVNAYSDHEVRRALGPLRAMAEELDVLVVFVRHLRKSGGNSAVTAGGGSNAFSALSRAVLTLGFDPNDDTPDQNDRRRVLTVAKMSLARMPASLAFRIESAPDGGSKIQWEGVSAVTADELVQSIAAPPTSDDPSEQRDVDVWLLGALKDKIERTKKEILIAAKEDSYAQRTVERAAKRIGVTIVRKGFGEGSVWSLPDPDSPIHAIHVAITPIEKAGVNGVNGRESTADAAEVVYG